MSNVNYYTIIGNCQSYALITFLESNPTFKNKYSLLKTQLIYEFTEEGFNDLYTNILPVIDLLIIQPILALKGEIRTATKNIISYTKSTCKIIIFPVSYINFYYPDLTFIKTESDIFIKPSDCHYRNLIKLYLENPNESDDFFINQFTKIVNDLDFFQKEYIDDLIKNDIEELTKRENTFPDYIPDDLRIVYYIKVSQFIQDNYDKNFLFYSLNHPSKFLFYYILEQIHGHLDIEKFTYPSYIDPISGTTCIIYKSVSKIINFDQDYDQLIMRGKTYNIANLIIAYINAYRAENYDYFRNLCLKSKII